MITALSLILLLLPFSLVTLFKDKKKGFLTIFSLVSCTHVVIALVTQALGIFTYPVVISIHIVLAIASMLVLGRLAKKRQVSLKRQFGSFVRSFGLKSIAQYWLPIACMILAFYLLLSLHYNFTGRVDTGMGLSRVNHSSYTYPLYSDEWVGASLAGYSIQSRSLPIVNPLNANQPFPNFLFVSHSLVSEVILVLDMNPLRQYVQIGMLNTLILVFLLYAVIRSLGVRSSIAALSAFSALLLTNSGNLPGLWFLLPYNISLTFLLASVLAATSANRDWRLFYLLIGLALLLYPPMVVFVLPMIIASLPYFKQMITKIGATKVSCISLIVGLAVICSAIFTVLFMIKGFSLTDVFSKAASYVIRDPLDMGRVYYFPWNILPWYSIPFVLLGIFAAWKAKAKLVLYPAMLGLILWVMYCFIDTVVLIEVSRAVVITSVFFMIMLGLGLEVSYSYIQRKITSESFDLDDKVMNVGIKIILIVFLAIWVMNISRFGMWHRMPLHVKGTSAAKLIPAPPVTRYLHSEDLELFKSFKGKRFIAPPWKGLVIGAATQNYPLDSKSATITNRILTYREFMDSDCAEKTALAQKYNISLSYGKAFTCSNFKELGKSIEGFYLYEFTGQKGAKK